MDEFEVEYDEDGNGYYVSRRLIPTDFAVIGLGLVRDLFTSVASAVAMTQSLVANHANYQTDRRLFQQQAAIEIETLTSGDDEDG